MKKLLIFFSILIILSACNSTGKGHHKKIKQALANTITGFFNNAHTDSIRILSVDSTFQNTFLALTISTLQNVSDIIADTSHTSAATLLRLAAITETDTASMRRFTSELQNTPDYQAYLHHTIDSLSAVRQQNIHSGIDSFFGYHVSALAHITIASHPFAHTFRFYIEKDGTIQFRHIVIQQPMLTQLKQ